MKKRVVIAISTVLSILLIVVVLTGGFTRGIISKKIYRPQNVYEEIWNLVLTERNSRNSTVLTSSDGSEVDFDFGFDFVGIHIPECNLTISPWRLNESEELSFSFSWKKGVRIQFVYNYETKTLTGNRDFSYFMENFLEDYFAWCEADLDFSSRYSAEDLGKYEFRFERQTYEFSF